MQHRLMDPPAAAALTPGTDTLNLPSSFVPEELKACIESSLACFEACEDAIEHCLSKSDSETVPPSLISILQDCAEIAQVASSFMLRGSAFHIRTCAICSEVARICAEACEAAATQVENGDEILRACAIACRKCSDCSHRMAHHH